MSTQLKNQLLVNNSPIRFDTGFHAFARTDDQVTLLERVTIIGPIIVHGIPVVFLREDLDDGTLDEVRERLEKA